jgi:hypothetical protein
MKTSVGTVEFRRVRMSVMGKVYCCWKGTKKVAREVRRTRGAWRIREKKLRSRGVGREGGGKCETRRRVEERSRRGKGIEQDDQRLSEVET